MPNDGCGTMASHSAEDGSVVMEDECLSSSGPGGLKTVNIEVAPIDSHNDASVFSFARGWSR